MSFPSLGDPRAVRPLHVVMIALTTAVVSGGFLLLSAAESTVLVDGAAAWTENSPLRAVVQLLCLNYRLPTIYAGDIKGCIVGFGAGVGLLALAFAVVLRNPAEGEDPNSHAADPLSTDPHGDAVKPIQRRHLHISPLIAAQAAIGLYLLWSFASARWSDAPELAIGGSVLLTIFFLWSFALGHGLSPLTARIAARIVVAMTAIAALTALWYYYGRNWTLRAKFPFGNPNFLAVCLIPGILLSASLVIEKVCCAAHESTARRVVCLLGALTTLTLSLWAFALADSRGPLLGLGAGMFTMVFFALRGWLKLLPAIIGIALAISAGLYLNDQQHKPQAGARDATLRYRTYAWSYAWRLAREKPFNGHGQAAYVRKADLFTAEDVEDDPLVLSARVDHAHNEWLEVLADLGVVGLALVGGGLFLTFLAGSVALNIMIPRDRRWTLIALLGSLAAIIVSECFGVGLRTAEVPVAFYTVLGLIWALTAGPATNLVCRLGTSRWMSLVTGAILATVGILAVVLAQQDFRAARRAFQVDAAIAAGNHEDAMAHALQAVNQLNPQRALTNLYRLAEARMRISRDLLTRAVDRETRARSGELPDRALLQIASSDRAESEQHAGEANRVVKELITRSPGFMNHGYVEFMLNLIAADHAAAKGDEQQRFLAVQNAARAVERELRRQPFDAHIARDYVRVAARGGDVASILHTLARPLRHNSVTSEDLAVLSPLAERPEFENYLRQLIADHAFAGQAVEDSRKWRPEELRLAGAYWFAHEKYEDALAALTAATKDYAALGSASLIGAASAHAELADVQFFAHPEDAAAALAHADAALSQTPDSRPGRELRAAINRRRVDYLLAAGREDDARQLWLQISDDDGTTEQPTAEIADRYRRLSDSLLRSRLTSAEAVVPADLLSRIQQWLARAVALDERSPAIRLSLANVFFLSSDDLGASAQLLAALDRGLSPDTAQRFLDIVRQRGRDMQAYSAVTQKLDPVAPIHVAPIPVAPIHVAPVSNR